MRFWFLIQLCFVATIASLPFPVVAEEASPNIILILADDMGVGEMSHTGGLVPTPALDRMAL
ncbi:MAG: hypothetical protein AAGF67_06365, partial [Verrucomicrobiota bacterium]